MTGWLLCSVANGERCSLCGVFALTVWKFWEGIVCVQAVCVECAEKA